MDELRVAKIKLYLCLLAKTGDKRTEAEIKICYELGRDGDIQAALEKHLEMIKERG